MTALADGNGLGALGRSSDSIKLAEASRGIKCAVVAGCNRGERRWGEKSVAGNGWSSKLGSITWVARESERRVGVMPTLGSSARFRVSAGDDLFGTGVAAMAKMSASCWMASICASPREARGDVGVGLRMAQ
jgi:hypothetical protein